MIYRLSKQLNKVQILIGAILSFAFLALGAYFFLGYSHANAHDLSLEAMQISEGEDGEISYSVGGISLPKGEYELSIGYLSDGVCNLAAYLDNDGQTIFQELPESGASGNIINISYNLTFPKDSGRITVTAPAGTKFSFVFIRFSAPKAIYSDGLIWGVVCLFGLLITWVIIFKYSTSNEKIAILISIVSVIITTLPAFLPGKIPVGGDLRAHLYRIEGVYFGLLDHQFPVVIYPEWNNTYGQLGILYPNLFLYIPALFRITGMSIIGMIRLTKLIMNCASAIAFYKASAAVFKKEWQRIVTFLLLTFEYTRMYGVFNGGKLGGALIAELFIPVLIAGLINVLYADGDKWHYIGIGLAGVFCSHIISAVVSCLMVMVIILINVRKFTNADIIKKILKAAGLFIILILGSYAAFLKYYFVDWSSANLAWSVFTDTLWRISDPLFDPRWNSVIVYLAGGAILLIMIKVKKVTFTKGCFSTHLFAVALFFFWLSTVYFPWGFLRQFGMFEALTDMLQSGNRFVAMVGELSAFAMPIFMEMALVNVVDVNSENNITGTFKLPQSMGLYITFAVIGIQCIVNDAVATNHYLNDVDINVYDNIAAEIEYEAEDYLPTGTQTEYYSSDAGYISDDSIVSTYEYSRAGSHILYTYTAKSDGEYVEFPKFFYPGYEVTDENGAPYMFEKGERNRIKVYLPMTETIKAVHIKYGVPGYLGVLYLISMAGWGYTLLICLIKGDKSANVNKMN